MSCIINKLNDEKGGHRRNNERETQTTQFR